MFIMNDSILRTGDICIVQLKSKYHVMKVSQNRENGGILLNSLYSDGSPNTLSEKDNFTIFGKVVLMYHWIYSDNNYCSMNNKKTNLLLMSD